MTSHVFICYLTTHTLNTTGCEMVSTLLKSQLEKYLGKYLELSDTTFSVSWGAEVKLKDVKLKESAISEFDLPFKVVHGKVAR